MSDAKMFWKVQKELCKDNLIGIQAIGDDEFLIALVFEPDNAKLIAAAPQLLDALQFALERLKIVERESDYDHRTFHQGIAIDKAIAAINKATGEQS